MSALTPFYQYHDKVDVNITRKLFFKIACRYYVSHNPFLLKPYGRHKQFKLHIEKIPTVWTFKLKSELYISCSKNKCLFHLADEIKIKLLLKVLVVLL